MNESKLKIPCEKCITLAICRVSALEQSSLILLTEKCKLINDYLCDEGQYPYDPYALKQYRDRLTSIWSFFGRYYMKKEPNLNKEVSTLKKFIIIMLVVILCIVCSYWLFSDPFCFSNKCKAYKTVQDYTLNNRIIDEFSVSNIPSLTSLILKKDIIYYGDDSYIVGSHIDFKNGYGEKVRVKYFSVVILESDIWVVTYFNSTERSV